VAYDAADLARTPLRPGPSMEIPDLIAALSDPAAYPHPVDDVEVIQTHISVVFLAGEFVYKVKKPVDLGFLDFTTLEKRKRFCHEEVRLNRRLAPHVYLGVVPVVAADAGLRFDVEAVSGKRGGSEPVSVDGGALEAASEDGEGCASPPETREWAVRMRRLPEDLTLESWVAEDAIRPYHVAVIGRRIAGFHAGAARGPEISRWGRFEVVAGNARENLEQSRVRFDGDPLRPELFERLSSALERELDRLEAVIERRAEAGVPVDTHGDLHLDHVYIFPDRDPPDDLVVIDCIEFNERFRYADPIADIAFLEMDLRFHGREDLAMVLADAYLDAADDPEGRLLVPFYAAYRAAVRAKVAGIRASEDEIPEAERAADIESERAHWLLALGLLETRGRRPGLVLIGGLPGTGKSTLAVSLAERAGFGVLASDPTRKELAGLDPGTSAADAFGAGIYTAECNDRTYDALLERAEARLLEGGRVIVDASFREDGRREAFLDLARRHRVPALFLVLEAPPARVRQRIASRHGGPSDADVDIYEAAAARWEAASPATARATRHVDTGQSHAWSVEQSVAHLADVGLL